MIRRERQPDAETAGDEIATGFGVPFWSESMIARYLLDPKEWEGLREEAPVRFRDLTRREESEEIATSLNNIIYRDARKCENFLSGIDRGANVHYIQVNK